MRALRLRFEAGVRSNWHSHAGWQILAAEEGRGLTQARDGEIIENGARRACGLRAGGPRTLARRVAQRARRAAHRPRRRRRRADLLVRPRERGRVPGPVACRLANYIRSRHSPRRLSRVEERRVAGRGRWLIRRFRNRAAGRVPWVRFLPPLSEPGGPISGTGLSSGIMRLAHGLPGHDQRTGLASPGTRLAPLSRPAGASSGLLTPWRRRPLGSSPSLVHVMTSGIPAHLRGDRPFGHSREPAPFRHRFHLRSLPSAGITRLPRYLRTSPPP